jgi:hypothetical protein
MGKAMYDCPVQKFSMGQQTFINTAIKTHRKETFISSNLANQVRILEWIAISR